MYAALSLVAEKSPSFNKACVAISTGHLSEKLGDMKLKKPAGDTLLLYAEKTSLSFVLGEGTAFGFRLLVTKLRTCLSKAYEALGKQKAPKVIADSIGWIGQAITEFGIAGLSLRALVDFLKEGLKNTNAAVRSSATNTLVTLRLFSGPGMIILVACLPRTDSRIQASRISCRI